MLTAKQKQLLSFLIDHTTRNDGVSPSFDEMKDHLELASKSGIHRMIVALEDRGFIERLKNRRRAIQVIKYPDGTPVHGGSGNLLERLVLAHWATLPEAFQERVQRECGLKPQRVFRAA